MKPVLAILAVVTLSIIFVSPVQAADYTKYERNDSEKAAITMTVDKTEWIIERVEGEEQNLYICDISSIKRKGTSIHCGEDVVVTESAIQIEDFVLDFNDVRRISARRGSHSSQIVLAFILSDSTNRKSSFQRRMSDVVSCRNSIRIKADDFIRGAVVAFFGDISVDGEVNRDVIALLGDIYIGGDAVVRGDAIAVNGKVHMHKNASVYGSVKSGKGKSSSRQHRAKRWKHSDNSIKVVFSPAYNRVDGMHLNGGIEYNHPDSILPSFYATGGYAFASDRWRYDFGLSQTIVRGPVAIEVGGRVFRTLKSDDNRIIDVCENSVFATLFNEDWMDYYEAEGAYGFVRLSPLGWNKIEIGYLAEKYRWFDSNPKLWSLFGKKNFRGNFSSVPFDTLQVMKKDLQNKKLTSLIARYTLDTRDEENQPWRGWYGDFSYEFSPERWNGDFDFTRIEGKLSRLLRLNRYQSLIITGAYGYARGDYLPLNRHFFLGGLGTIHGTRHKEFIGREYVYTSAEYSFSIPHTDVNPFIQYDGGKIAAERLGNGTDWISSISVGVDFSNSFRVFISQRLDVGDADPIFYARFSTGLFN